MTTWYLCETLFSVTNPILAYFCSRVLDSLRPTTYPTSHRLRHAATVEHMYTPTYSASKPPHKPDLQGNLGR